MKKILPFLVFSFIYFHSQAQNLIILDEDGNDISNSSVTFEFLPSDGNISHEFSVGNQTDNEIVVSATRYEMNCTSTSFEFYCWSICLPPQMCGSNFERVMPSPLTVAANSVSPSPLAFDFNPSSTNPGNGLEGTATYVYVMFDLNNPNDSVFVEVNYTISTTVGIEEHNENLLSTIYPNPADNAIFINVNGTIAQAQFEVYSLLGKQVKQIIKDNASGKVSIDIADLRPGVYFLTEQTSGLSRKFIISR